MNTKLFKLLTVAGLLILLASLAVAVVYKTVRGAKTPPPLPQTNLSSPMLPTSDTIGLVNNLETKNGFSAQFWMTTDEQIFLTWEKSGAIRSLKPSIQIKRNTPIFLALFMANPGVKSIVSPLTGATRSRSDVTFDLYLISPNGTLALADTQRVGWRGSPPSPGLVYLAKDRGSISFEVIDPLGEYTVVLIIHDNVRKVDMKLARKLDLVD